MKKHIFLVVALLFSALCLNVFAQTKSYPFEVVKSGKGKQSILFIPGFASSGEVWNDTKANFEKSFTCYTLTMAGFAGVPPQANASFKNWEEAIVSYIQDHKIVKPIIIGHSMGGGLALAIAADYPDLADRIVVVDAVPCLAALMDSSFKAKENNDCAPMIAAMMSLTDQEFHDNQKKYLPKLTADATKHELLLGWSTKSDRKTFGEMYCDFSNTDLRDKIATVKCPALVLLESYFVNLKPAIEEQYKKLKPANLQYATKGLHFIMYDDKDFYFKHLNNFIKVK
ncbi:alpha/beta hydrolase [Flavobacterium circumlabens]|uniref:Alpha/beta hydrolase n=1 Tax=Flavobacterium circumlabens TaxID=2133765 RepID=A0A4Y7U9R4_9FLAO|nr:alpha/beta hydrolase [Flavobacterium circumlabens]TCN53901.1 pimeloyl-ACP methyl ester carboxylesterase [Flavobacterium circumlabens]TEB42512.1 alpha/beta hydrolase [Flavobacterium circumlabens]